ncbi:hypothetical protein ABBQ38_006047 [Trebouxia sp. C0009 RCD-2024]
MYVSCVECAELQHKRGGGDLEQASSPKAFGQPQNKVSEQRASLVCCARKQCPSRRECTTRNSMGPLA